MANIAEIKKKIALFHQNEKGGEVRIHIGGESIKAGPKGTGTSLFKKLPQPYQDKILVKYGLKEIKKEEPEIKEIKKEEKEIKKEEKMKTEIIENDIETFKEKLLSIKGIGEKTVEDILDISETEEELRILLKASDGDTPFRSDIEKKLREVFS